MRIHSFKFYEDDYFLNEDFSFSDPQTRDKDSLPSAIPMFELERNEALRSSNNLPFATNKHDNIIEALKANLGITATKRLADYPDPGPMGARDDVIY